MTASTDVATAATPSPLTLPPALGGSLFSRPLPIALHEHVWRAGQMGSARSKVTPTGHAALDQALPNQGWPHGGLIELLLPQSGIGELRLLQAALHALGEQSVALLQPPYVPHIAAWRDWGLSPQRLLWIRTQRQADALWSAEQVLRSDSCGALLLWQTTLRHESLRRLQLAAQASHTLCWIFRPLSARATASPAPLRIALQPLAGGVQLDILKRRGPVCAAPLQVFWSRGEMHAATAPRTATETSDALLDRHHSDPLTVAGAAPALV